ncbi:MAG: MBL fold metallo-hydrolase [Gammaproteobacteria bacterium]|jgi:glyoxylase-like metal-dependent hydrolase (beta-lactamase superfamily II)|nr:MBL fold metallo-hydrolase [Gammaproteobacteria bacterium]MBP6052358.1 MBL fold metallo-hydrolase [Pseudomonadales bacterium]MBK6584808.1 MBL fold metallo-hydrolase [Gammaproteobacteria bacterium]MBK7169983.1 MBL fold metallo-hydrolase [Gammaproteobacteria bacterium]MBK7519681.1 MBL fold metallo-hydrolase [Gammaproteobacteria bacterium]
MHEQLDHGIFCLETGYQRPGTACCYLLVDHGEAAFIETGTAHSVPLLLEALAQAGVAREQVRYVIPTHVHLDHAGGAGALLQHLPAATLLVHPRGARHLIDPERLIEGAQQVYGPERFAELYGRVVAAPAERVCEALDHSSWPLGNRHLLVRDTPGHARHHFCVWDEPSRGWFSGDTFGVAYRELARADEAFMMPTTTPVQFDPEALIASIELLMSYDPANVYLTHFGRIRASRTQADSLREQLGDYQRICAPLAGDVDEERWLQDALGDYTVARLRSFGCTWEDARIRSFLDLDLRLNAQGLSDWRQRSLRA